MICDNLVYLIFLKLPRERIDHVCLWQKHCESSLGSLEWMWTGARWLPTRSQWMQQTDQTGSVCSVLRVLKIQTDMRYYTANYIILLITERPWSAANAGFRWLKAALEAQQFSTSVCRLPAADQSSSEEHRAPQFFREPSIANDDGQCKY